MSMKKLRINEQTFTVVDEAAAKKTADTDLNMNDHFIHNISDGVQNNDAATVGQLNATVGDIGNALDSILVMQDELMGGDKSDCGGYQLLAQTILAEDANEIIWTQTKDSEPLSDYKDFFIYWVGKFDVTNTANEPWMCRANNGGIYFCYIGVPKRADVPSGFWWEIKEMGKLPDGTNSIYKTTYPNRMLMNFQGDFTYDSQGLAENNRTVNSDISTGTTISHIRFGSLSSGSKMVAGSKAILLGRKR